MHTRPLLTDAPTPEISRIEHPSIQPALWWKANHTQGPLPVEGGWPAARVLVGAIDGASWPWTIIHTDPSPRWFQVLGDPRQCLLELGHGPHVQMVFRHGENPRRRVPLPAGCTPWIGAINSDEAHTISVAFDIGKTWTQRGALSGAFGFRKVHSPYRTGA